MNTKTTLILALVAAGIAVYVVLVDKPWEAPKPEVEVKSTAVALFDSKFEDADRVEVQRRDGKKLIFAKDPEEKAWKMLEPLKSPAPEYQVKSMIDRVAEIKYLRKYGPDDKDRPSEKVSGLNEPAATARIFRGDKELASVVVGSRLPPGGKGSYVKVNSDVTIKVDGKDRTVSTKDVLESQNDLSDAFMAKLDTFRDKNVLKFDLNDVKRVKMEGDRNYVLVKSGDNWVLDSPVRGRADKSKAENVVRAMTSLYVAEFKDDEPVSYTSYGLDPARLKVTVETEKTMPPKANPGDPDTKPADTQPATKAVTYELQVGGVVDQTSTSKQYFARLGDQPSVFSINEYTYKQLATDVAELQDKKIASITTTKVKTVKAETPDGSVTLTRQEKGGWQDGDGKAADTVAVEDLLKAVSDLQAVKYVDATTELINVDWDHPRAKITLTEEGSLNPVTVLVGPASASGKMVFVKNAAEEPVAAVHDDAVAALLAGPVSYRDRSVMKFDRTRAKRVEIEQPGRDKVVLAQVRNEWAMVEPIAGAVDRDAVRNLMQDLSGLLAKRVVGTGDKVRFGLDKPALSLAVHVEPLTADPNTVVVGGTATQPAASPATQPATTAPAGQATTRPAKPLAVQIKQIEELLEFQKTNPNENPLATDMLKKRLAELQAQAETQPASESATQPAAVAQAPATQPAAPAGPTILRLHLAQK
ncbi:MAG: DUF4340 domain-containing protein, partial [Planctomycetes bacterium]|nr:DUF4340 domain-containing protein [Planctomycetota bacterium]